MPCSACGVVWREVLGEVWASEFGQNFRVCALSAPNHTQKSTTEDTTRSTGHLSTTNTTGSQTHLWSVGGIVAEAYALWDQ